MNSPQTEPSKPTFREELTSLINKFSQDTWCDTPDFVLAEYLLVSLGSYHRAIERREEWYGRKLSKDLLTKKDQEHKAELESIKGEIENSIAEPTELEDVRIYNIALKDTISILDSHINKLSTE